MGTTGATSTLALFGPIRQYAGYGANILQPSGFTGNEIVITASSTLDYSRAARFTNGVLIGGTIGNSTGSYGDDQASIVIGGTSYGGPSSYYNVIMGVNANTAADAAYNTLIGQGATLVTSAVATCCGTSIGADSKVAKFGVAVGNNAWGNATSSIAIGYNAKVIGGANSAAFGPVTVTAADTYSYGGSSIKHGFGTTTPATKLHVSSGASATTTVSIGELGLSSSKACVNMNRSDGGAGSFYINAAGAGVFEANYCR